MFLFISTVAKFRKGGPDVMNGTNCRAVQNYFDNDLGKLPEPLQNGESQNGCEFPVQNKCGGQPAKEGGRQLGKTRQPEP